MAKPRTRTSNAGLRGTAGPISSETWEQVRRTTSTEPAAQPNDKPLKDIFVAGRLVDSDITSLSGAVQALAVEAGFGERPIGNRPAVSHLSHVAIRRLQKRKGLPREDALAFLFEGVPTAHRGPVEGVPVWGFRWYSMFHDNDWLEPLVVLDIGAPKAGGRVLWSPKREMQAVRSRAMSLSATSSPVFQCSAWMR